jgi:acyl-coenzyme A thioesterase PaaI-like protein
MGLLHGRASVALAESVGSAASFFINAKNKSTWNWRQIIWSIHEGVVTGTARITQRKNAASVGNKITDEEEFDFALQVD